MHGRLIAGSIPACGFAIGHKVGTTDGIVNLDRGDCARRSGPSAQRPARVLDLPVLFQDFGESSLDFTLIVWVDEPREQARVASDLRFAIDQAFRREGIAIPFPQRDLHLKSGFPPS